MTSKIHRRTPSSDGTVETILTSSSAPSRSSSDSSSTIMDEKDIESNAYNNNGTTKPLLPTRGRSAAIGGAPPPPPSALETTNGSDPKSDKLSSSAWKALSACLNYSFCSVSMILVNKSLASRYVCVCVRTNEGRNE